jgi:hypothetical protein
MKARLAVLVALAVAVTLASVAAAGPAAAKQRVGITMKNLPGGAFVFAPVRAPGGLPHRSVVPARDGRREAVRAAPSCGGKRRIE